VALIAAFTAPELTNAAQAGKRYNYNAGCRSEYALDLSSANYKLPKGLKHYPELKHYL
jgi:hypothetical protein